MLDKTLEDHNTGFELALAWCVNANSSLANVRGFSSFQLALGQNPKIPSIFHDKPQALSPINTSKILPDNLLLLHKNRHTLQVKVQKKYVEHLIIMSEPGKVLGQDGQQVLVKCGSNYVRVHPCRLALERNHNDKNLYNISDPDMQHSNIQQLQRFVNPNTDTYLDSDSDTEHDLQNENENNSDKDMNTLSNSMEWLRVTGPNLSQIDTNTNKIS